MASAPINSRLNVVVRFPTPFGLGRNGCWPSRGSQLPRELSFISYILFLIIALVGFASYLTKLHCWRLAPLLEVGRFFEKARLLEIGFEGPLIEKAVERSSFDFEKFDKESELVSGADLEILKTRVRTQLWNYT